MPEGRQAAVGLPTHFTPQAVEIFLPNARILRKRRDDGAKLSRKGGNSETRCVLSFIYNIYIYTYMNW